MRCIVPILGFLGGIGMPEVLIIAAVMLGGGGALVATIVLAVRAASGSTVSSHAYCPHCGKQLR